MVTSDPKATYNVQTTSHGPGHNKVSEYEFMTRRLSKRAVIQRYINAKPVLIDNRGQIFKIKKIPVNRLGNFSFNWPNKNNPSCPVVLEDTPCKLKVLKEITTYHSNGCDSLFKPDVEEVLNQLPEDLLGKKIYFSTRAAGDGTVYDQDARAFRLGFHTGTTTFYEDI